ncbi:MAG TPA: hypothetical protein VD815_06270 [Candidatus Saccharimonadales bacterium]|nr:hypothetical protein [Candidatus Saccharimonadales bacterium]
MIRGQNENLKKNYDNIVTVYTIISMVIIGGGITHILLTFIGYTELSEEAIWFAGSGLALVTIGVFNYIIIRTHGNDQIINTLSYILNASGITMLILSFFVLVNEPQPIILVILLIFASIFSLKMRKYHSLLERQ